MEPLQVPGGQTTSLALQGSFFLWHVYGLI